MEFRRELDCIYIVGKGPTWASSPSIFYKEHGENEEVWGVGSIYRTHRCLDRIFIMHDPRQEVIFEDRDFAESIEKYGKPVYANDGYEGCDGLVEKFPADMMLEAYPIHYFANTIAWMLALAISLKPKKISLHGVDFHYSVEHLPEKGCVEFWLGVASMGGIEISVHPRSTLLKSTTEYGNIYGFIPLRKSNGLIKDYTPEYIDGIRYLDGTRPQILKAYKLVPVNHEEEA